MNTRNVFLINILMAVLWAAYQDQWSTNSVVIGFVVGYVLLSILHRGYGSLIFNVVSYVIFLIWSILKSSVQVAWIVLKPTLKLDQGIVAIPLEAQTDLEVSLLATSITLTPGTLSVDTGWDAQDEHVLYVHNLVMGNADDVRRSIKQDFERRILRITRGGKVS